MQLTVIFAVFGLVLNLILSLIAEPRRASVEGFFGGQGADGRAPGLWVLVLSQVTTWIFARSLMNAAILGYFYGIAGTLAYAAYYGSFLTGGYIVARLRAGGAVSVQDWLGARFALAFVALVASPGFSLGAVLTAPGTSGGYLGWVLLAVAALQVFSYPAHDPVMMDRGFIADPATTRASFLHAFWISALCIIGFGFFGIQASLVGAANEGELIGTWAGMFPGWVFAATWLASRKTA